MVRCAFLLLLIFSKYFYMASITSYFSFYLIEKFHLPVQIGAALPVRLSVRARARHSDRRARSATAVGRKRVIWFSILGVAPFTMVLPYVDLVWTGILSFLIGLILSSAFSAILVFAQELMPGKIGAVSGPILRLRVRHGRHRRRRARVGGRPVRHRVRVSAVRILAAARHGRRAPARYRTPLGSGYRSLDAPTALLVTQYGLLIVGTNVLFDQIGLPVPAMPTLVVAGALAADGIFGARPVFSSCP